MISFIAKESVAPFHLNYLLLIFVLFTVSNSQTLVGVYCNFTAGQKQNCREYCAQYFKAEPQLTWYNITSHNCQPLRICIWYLHYYDYATNQCYVDATMQVVAPSQIPDTLIRQMVATFNLDAICVNGEADNGFFSDVPCYCFQLWEDSGTVDLNGYPFKCDKVIEPSQWKGYFLNSLIIGKNGTVIMYGQYTPEHLQIMYEEQKSQQSQQTVQFIYKYEATLLQMIYQSIPQQSLIRNQNQLMSLLAFLIFLYIVFAFSYLRFQAQLIKVTKQQLIQRIQSILNSKMPLQNQV